MIISLLSLGLAASPDYEVMIPIPGGPGQHLPEVDEFVYGRLLPNMVQGLSDQVVSSTSSMITCEIDGGNVRAILRATPSTWGQIPAYADCTVQGTVLRVRPTISSKYHRLGFTGGTSINFAQGLLMEMRSDESGSRTYLLPGGNYSEGFSDGVLNGALWSGVRCYTGKASNGQFYLRVYSVGATHGKGSCQVPASQGQPHNLTILLEG